MFILNYDYDYSVNSSELYVCWWIVISSVDLSDADKIISSCAVKILRGSGVSVFVPVLCFTTPPNTDSVQFYAT